MSQSPGECFRNAAEAIPELLRPGDVRMKASHVQSVDGHTLHVATPLRDTCKGIHTPRTGSP
jgi:hypothetical protein